MNVATGFALGIWAALTLASVLTWLPLGSRRNPPWLSRPAVLIGVVVVLVVGTGLVALLGGLGAPVTGGWRWVAVGIAAAAACLSGGSFATSVLDLADSSSRTGTTRVQRDQLRGGAWIGAFERIGMVATVLSGWPEGLAGIVAIKGLARYPELKQTPTSGVTERFIIGTFASLAWAGVCAGVAVILLTG